jgi:hypothetical protein
MTTATPPKKTVVIFAGEIFDGRDKEHPKVRDLDGNEIIVRVRAMPARHLGRVLALCQHEALLLEFLCYVRRADQADAVAVDDKEAPPEIAGWATVPLGWADNLDDASHELLLEAGKRLNFSRAASWGQRQIEAKQFQQPLLLKTDEMLAPVVEKMVHLLVSSLQRSGLPVAPTTTS